MQLLDESTVSLFTSGLSIRTQPRGHTGGITSLQTSSLWGSGGGGAQVDWARPERPPKSLLRASATDL